MFYDDEDRYVYPALLREYTERYGPTVWAYCLLPNHIHLLAVPQSEGSMALAMGRAAMRYARWLNKKRGWSGHLWEIRYFSSALDEEQPYTSTGCPSGSKGFIEDLGLRLERLLNRRKPGRKPKTLDEGTPDMFGGGL